MSTIVLDSIPLRLRTLRDIEGVLGSFVVGKRGELLARDVSAACGSEILANVGRRLQQLCNAFATADVGGPFEATTLHFAQYKLHVRALGNVLIVAIVSAEANLPALKMAINLLGRQLLLDLASLGRESRPGRQPVAGRRAAREPQRPSREPPPAAVPSQRDSGVPARSYRGTRVAN